MVNELPESMTAVGRLSYGVSSEDFALEGKQKELCIRASVATRSVSRPHRF